MPLRRGWARSCGLTRHNRAQKPTTLMRSTPAARMRPAHRSGCERPSSADAGEHHHRDGRAFVCPFGAVGHVRPGSRDPPGLPRPARAHATRAGTRDLCGRARPARTHATRAGTRDPSGHTRPERAHAPPSGHSPAPADASRPQAFGGQGPSPPGPPSVLPSPPCDRYFSNSCAIASPLASGESTVSRACSSCSM